MKSLSARSFFFPSSIPNENNLEYGNLNKAQKSLKLTEQGTNAPVNEIQRAKLQQQTNQMNSLAIIPTSLEKVSIETNNSGNTSSKNRNKILIKAAIDLNTWGDSLVSRQNLAKLYNISDDEFDEIDKILKKIKVAQRVSQTTKTPAEKVIFNLAKKMGIEETLLNSDIDFKNDDYGTMLQKLGATAIFGSQSDPETTKKVMEEAATEAINGNLPATISNDDSTKGLAETKESILSRYLSQAGAGIGSLVSSLGGWGNIALGAGAGLAAAGAAYGGYKLYKHYKNKKKREEDINHLKQQTENFYNHQKKNYEEENLQFLIGLSPKELDNYEKSLLSGHIKVHQRLVSTSDLIDLLASKYGNNENLMRIAYVQAQNDYHMSIRNKKQIPQKIINFLKIMNIKYQNHNYNNRINAK